jgi:hypothetical protein
MSKLVLTDLEEELNSLWKIGFAGNIIFSPLYH